MIENCVDDTNGVSVVSAEMLFLSVALLRLVLWLVKNNEVSWVVGRLDSLMIERREEALQRSERQRRRSM